MASVPFRWLKRAILVVAVAYLVLLIPASSPDLPQLAPATPFVWDADATWDSLQNGFEQVRQGGCDSVGFSELVKSTRHLLSAVANENATAADPRFDGLETRIFEMAMHAGACPGYVIPFCAYFSSLRFQIKALSKQWDMTHPTVMVRLYRLLYGGRAALEEVLLQHEDFEPPTTIGCVDEESYTPPGIINGIEVHSGDLLVSRGGAPTSALIARGNDFPGNFSHVALVHVDEYSGRVSIIEAHIEKGVAIATPDEYLADKKLRIMVLRPRANLPQLIADPMLPHKAATAALERAQREHIPYDFEMDFDDPSKLFCSEVASSPYADLDLTLWMKLSTISSPGVGSWLAAFGVRHFETQAPSDLEYDPQLSVVAEWRDPETLWQDHIDNAILDAMIEQAESEGRRLDYDWWMLPFGRVLKAYSWVLNKFGKVGPVPEGMDAAAALRNDRFSKDHAEAKARLMPGLDDFRQTHGYRAPYWELLRLARQAVHDK